MDDIVAPILCAWIVMGLATAGIFSWVERRRSLIVPPLFAVPAETLVLCLIGWPIVLYGVIEDHKRRT